MGGVSNSVGDDAAWTVRIRIDDATNSIHCAGRAVESRSGRYDEPDCAEANRCCPGVNLIDLSPPFICSLSIVYLHRDANSRQI